MHSTGRIRPLALLLVAALAACERKAPAPRNDTAVPQVTLPDSETTDSVATIAPWDSSAAGPILVIPAASPQEAMVVLPRYTDGAGLDTAHFVVDGVRGLSVDLFGHANMIGKATVASTTLPERVEDCGTWPTAHLASAGAIAPWTVGFVSGHAEALPTDSIEGLAHADSSRLAGEVARMSSSLPNDTAQAFRGLPFVVRSLRRFEPVPGTQTIVAEVVRTLSMEASPKQEHILVVAERDSANAPWTPVHVERSSGTEEELASTYVLGVVRLGPTKRPTIVLGRDLGEGSTYSLLERSPSTKRWRVRWTSAYAGC
jgi:hypothetical protein